MPTASIPNDSEPAEQYRSLKVSRNAGSRLGRGLFRVSVTERQVPCEVRGFFYTDPAAIVR